jgi:hypothetical protein
MTRAAPEKMTSPTTPLPERAPWALVIGGEPFRFSIVILPAGSKGGVWPAIAAVGASTTVTHQKKNGRPRLLKALLHKLMTGEIRVDELDSSALVAATERGLACR